MTETKTETKVETKVRRTELGRKPDSAWQWQKRKALTESKCRLVLVPETEAVGFDELVDRHIRSYERSGITPPRREDVEAGIFALLAAEILEYAR